MTLQNIINADHDFASLGSQISEWYDGLKAEETISGLLGKADSAIASVLPAAAIAGIVLAFSLLLAFFGKKTLGLQKFIGCLIIGAACGVYYVAPWVNTMFTLDAWIVGLIVGVVAALLCKLVYVIGYAVIPGYATYLVLVGGYYLPEAVTSVTKGNWIIGLVGAAVVIVVLFLLRKWVEMLGTAVAGGFAAYACIDALLAATIGGGFAQIAAIADYVLYVKIAIIAVIALLGFIVQAKTRRRY